jgi:hypothetical protein
MAITGNLKDFNITNLIQFNCIEKNTVQILINWKGYDASIFIKTGEIIHAKFRDIKGEPAIYKILRFDEGEFSITKPKAAPERTIFDSWKSLLLEGARVMDESLREKDTIVRSIALDLTKHSSIEKLLIITGTGECIQNNGFESPERYGAFASMFLEKSRLLSSALTFGDVIYASYMAGEFGLHFFQCDNYLIVVQMSRESNINSLFELINVLKSKLAIAEHETGKDKDDIVSEIRLQTCRT